MQIRRALSSHWPLLALLLGLTVAAALVSVLPPRLARQIIDVALPSGTPQSLWPPALLMGAAYLGKEALTFGQEYIGASLGLRITGMLRRTLWRHLLESPLGFFTATPRGEILQRVLTDAEALQGAAVRSFPRAIYDLTMALAAFWSMMRLNPLLTLLAVGTTLLALIPGRWAGQTRQRISLQTRTQQATLLQQVQERLEAIRLVKAFNAQEREAAHFRTVELTRARLELRAILVGQSFMNVPRMLEALTPMLLYIAGGYLLFAHRLTLGTLVALAAYLPMLTGPVRSLPATYLALKEASPKLAAVQEWLYLPAEPGRDRPASPATLQGDICFDNVSFTYPGSDHPVLDHVSFRIPTGIHTVITGPSGAGKSTLLALLLRLYEPDSGNITIGGQPLAAIHPDSLRKAAGVVMQESFLLNDTLRQNLTLGLERPAAPDALAAALAHARLTRVVTDLPQGLDTPLQERGSRLSGGERQRVALARALVRHPQLLLLDEATSSLDNENQAAVQASLRAASLARTTIAVAHRPSAVAAADMILRVENGHVTEVRP